jgi:uncharacterized protein (TIGR02145 family)
MKKLVFFLCITVFAFISAAARKNVAVVETDVDAQSGAGAKLNKAEVRQVTAELRSEAVKKLPGDKYNVMTSETVMAQGGATLVECAGENCVIALGGKIGADYIVRGTVSKLGARLTLSVEMYETENGNLVATSGLVRAENVDGLVEKGAAACAEMFSTFVSRQNSATPQVPPPQPPKSATHTVTANANPAYGGTVSLIPRKAIYNAGEQVTITAASANGYRFTGWSGGITGTENPGVITANGDMAFGANFQQAQPPSAPAYQPPATASYQPAAPAYQQYGGGGAGTFRDSRDGKIYGTVVIGGKTWMAENLNIKTEGSWCYENNESNCEKYGRLYNWNAAKTACPAGWHLPSRVEWDELLKASGGRKAGKKLKAKSGWNNKGNGTDDYGFSAQPGGNRYTGGNFNHAGYYGSWWMATEYGSSLAYYRGMLYNYDNVSEFYGDKGYGFSVRCRGD